MIHDKHGKCVICGWAHEFDEPHHAYAPGEPVDLHKVLCPDGKRRHLLRATAAAADMCSRRAEIRCGALLPGIEHSSDKCTGGVHIVVCVNDEERVRLLLEDDPDEPYNQYRQIVEHPLIVPGQPINISLTEDKSVYRDQPSVIHDEAHRKASR